MLSVLCTMCALCALLVDTAHINDIRSTINDILHDLDTEVHTTPTPTRAVTGGLIQGYINDDRTVDTYLGIPFAAPPTGVNRFKVPQPVHEWSDVLHTIHVPSACPQLKLSDSKLYVGNEDCLTLNVYAPHQSADSKEVLPVMIWFYGGAYVLGDSYSLGLYNGAALAEQHDIIVVVPNYRLGTLGFMALDELGAESDNREHSIGNMAMLDQRAAMQWVQQNIAAFGGNPNRVTIAGESAGM